MGKSLIQKKYYKLAGKVLENFVFYVPSQLLDKISKTPDHFEVLKPYQDILYVIDKMKGPVLFGESVGSYSLMENKFTLLELRRKYDPLEFDIIFQDYTKVVVLYKFITTLLLEEYTSSPVLDDDAFKSQLEWQKICLSQHFDTLKTIGSYNPAIFQESPNRNNLLELLDTHLSDHSSKENETPIQSNPKDVGGVYRSLSKKPKRKRVAIDEVEIERILLQTQFNLPV